MGLLYLCFYLGISFFLDSSVGTVMKQRPGVRGMVVRVPEVATDSYLLQGVQRSHAAYPDYYLVGFMDGFSGGKASGART
jgi:hypothetical protein